MQQRFEQLRSGFERTINWNKYQSKVLTKRQKQHLDFLTDPSFQGVQKKKNGGQLVHTGYYLSKLEIKDYSDKPVKSDVKTYDNIR